MNTRTDNRTHGQADLISRRIDLGLVLAVLVVWIILFAQFYWL